MSSTNPRAGTQGRVAPNGEPKHWKTLHAEMGRKPCPPIDSALPNWPGEERRRAWWFSLSRDGFVYTHHPSHTDVVTRLGEEPPGRRGTGYDPERIAEDLFCVPEQEHLRLLSVFENSRGGSILVTGYRGTGKSSLVNYTIDQLIHKQTKRLDERRRSRPSDAGVDQTATTDAHEGKTPSDGPDEKRPVWKYVPIRLNVSTSRDAVSLLNAMIKALFEASTIAQRFGKDPKAAKPIERAYSKSVATITTREADRDRRHHGFRDQADPTVTEAKGYEKDHTTDVVRTEHPYSLSEAQRDLCYCFEVLEQEQYKVIYILDELDKLTPSDLQAGADPRSKLVELQKIVSDLKYLLSEAPAFHVFIAGKDVDDSWQEDQNKGEGLFESVFVQNIYLPSAFTAVLRAALGPHSWVRDAWQNRKLLGTADAEGELRRLTRRFFQEMMGELDIHPHDWTFNTGLLVLPHLSQETIEMLLWRVALRILRAHDPEAEPPHDRRTALSALQAIGRISTLSKEDLDANAWLLPLLEACVAKSEKSPAGEAAANDAPAAIRRRKRELPVMSERSCRRLRYLLLYLTYKGRGIPRKILREFYSFVQERSVLGPRTKEYWEQRGDPKLIVYLPTHVRQKLKFFAAIVNEIAVHPEVFRVLDDKGCVATFHTTDYILKFFRTGFRWADILYAAFMTHRRELFPSRELVETILRVFEDVLIERVDRRHRAYRLMPQVRHDLEGLYLAFGPEQIELRFTEADLATEQRDLERIVRHVDGSKPEQRLESFKAQIRLAEIYEDLGHQSRACTEYSKALRWIRMDLERQMGALREAGATELLMAGTSTYLAAAVEVLQRLGYLYELEREFRKALHYYEESVLLQEEWWVLCAAVARRREAATRELGLPRLLGQSLGYRYRAERRVDDWSDPDARATPDGALLLSAIASMLPDVAALAEDDCPIQPFTGRPDGRLGSLRVLPAPLHAYPDPIGMPLSLNLMALTMEKMWHRLAANLHLLQTLDYYRAIHDRYGAIDQMILIGELMVRRRDLRLAARWYLLALREALSFQWADNPDRSSKSPEHQSSMRAKIFEHLGDLYLASLGEVYAPQRSFPMPGAIGPGSVRADIEAEMTKIRRQVGGEVIDSRDDEYFYSQAAAHYSINANPLRVCDVYMKKLFVRRERLVRSWAQASRVAKSLVDAQPLLADDALWTAASSWRFFWTAAEKALHALIDPRPGVRSAQPQDLGRIRDRRRFGAVYTQVGTMLMFAANRPALARWYWSPAEEAKAGGLLDNYLKHRQALAKEKYSKIEEDVRGRRADRDALRQRDARDWSRYTDLEATAATVDRILGVLLDNREMAQVGDDAGRQSRNLCAAHQLGYRSPLWHLSSIEWRACAKCDCRLTSRVLGASGAPAALYGCTAQWPPNARPVRPAASSESAPVGPRGTDPAPHHSSVSQDWRHHPNVYLVGHLYFLACCLEDKVVACHGPASPAEAKRRNEFRLTLRTLYRAELALLGANVMLYDNIRDLSAAEASRGLGVLYLDALRRLLDLRHLFREAKLEAIPGDAAPRPRADQNWENFVADFDRNLADLASLLQTAAKRFLVNAIDIFRTERQHERCTRQMLGMTYMALGDLMLVRAECFESARQPAGNLLCGSLDGLAVPWVAFDGAASVQAEHNKDRDPRDARRQAEEAYRSALREFLSEIEEYTKRYRFPHDTYLLHQNISDRRMHFEICKSIRGRHWNVTEWPGPHPSGQEAARALLAHERKVALRLFERYPDPEDRQTWMREVRELLDLASCMRPTPAYIRIVDPAATGGSGDCFLQWSPRPDDVPECQERVEGNANRAARRFFRSFDDGLAEVSGYAQRAGTAGLAE